MGLDHVPNSLNVSATPKRGNLMVIEAGQEEGLRSGLLVRTAKGREVLVVTKFLTTGGHRGMDFAVREMLAKEGDWVTAYQWGGEFRLTRSKSDPTQLHVSEINPTSGMLNEMGLNTDSKVLEAALKKQYPGLVIDGAAKKFAENGDEHLDPFMSEYVRVTKAANKVTYEEAHAAWVAGGKIDKEPVLKKPNFRHDMKNFIEASTITQDLYMRTLLTDKTPASAVQNLNDRLARRLPRAFELARIFQRDGLHLYKGEGEGRVDLLERFIAAGKQYAKDKTFGMTAAEMSEAGNAFGKYVDELGKLMDVEKFQYTDAQRALILDHAQFIQIQGPSALVPIRAATGP